MRIAKRFREQQIYEINERLYNLHATFSSRVDIGVTATGFDQSARAIGEKIIARSLISSLSPLDPCLDNERTDRDEKDESRICRLNHDRRTISRVDFIKHDIN